MTFDRAALDEMSIAAQRELREGNADRAADLFRQLVAAWTGIEGPDAEAVLNWRGWVAQSLIVARQYVAAEEVLHQLVVDRVRVLGADHPSVLVARGNLSKTVSLAGRHDEALLIAERLLADRTRLLGPDDEATLSTRGNIAEIHLQAGRPAVAAAAYESLLADRTRVLGETHHQTLITEDNLWSARLRLADPTAALDEMINRAREREAEYGPADPDTIVTFAKVAEAMMRVDRYADALPILEDVIGNRIVVFGHDDARTRNAQRLRALALFGLHRLDEAHDAIWAIINDLVPLGRDTETDAIHVYIDALRIDLERANRGGRSMRREASKSAKKAGRRASKLLSALEPDNNLRLAAEALIAKLGDID